jgi:hypothetical protein
MAWFVCHYPVSTVAPRRFLMFHVEHLPCHLWLPAVRVFHVEHATRQPRGAEASGGMFHVEHCMTGGWVKGMLGGSGPPVPGRTVIMVRVGRLYRRPRREAVPDD